MLTALCWSPTLAAASLEQPPVHVKGGCAQEVGCDVRECLQALRIVRHSGLMACGKKLTGNQV
jgi:hypothetical protein